MATKTDRARALPCWDGNQGVEGEELVGDDDRQHPSAQVCPMQSAREPSREPIFMTATMAIRVIDLLRRGPKNITQNATFAKQTSVDSRMLET
jgi:hypothetical protein